MDLDLGDLDLGCQRAHTTWVAFEATTPTYNVRPRRRKGPRGRATAAKMESFVNLGGKSGARGEQNLRPEQIEALRLKREPKDHSVTCLDQEDGEGNVEYKYRIKDPHPVRLEQLITQMKYRLSEGNGECFYYIGIEDNGYPKGLDPGELEASIATLHRMAASLAAIVTLVRHIPAAWGRSAALLHVATSTTAEAYHTDLRVAVAGSVDAGKSTLVAVLTRGSDGRPLLDNGRGLARMNVFRHKHEMQSGRTSSICHQLLGYDRHGRVINYTTPAATSLTPAEITAAAAKVLTFLDMGGHEKYFKTTLYGMTALLPDYGLMCVCAVAGLGRIAREHLAVAVALEVPVVVIITKVELVCPERVTAVVAEVRDVVALMLRHRSGLSGAHPGLSDNGANDEWRRVKEASPLVTNEADALASARVLCELHADSLSSTTTRGTLRVHMPIFAVSAVTGSGLLVLHTFLNALQPSAPSKGAGSTPLAPDCTPADDGVGVRSGSSEHVLDAVSVFTVAALDSAGGIEYASSMEAGSPRAPAQTAFCCSCPDALSITEDARGSSQTQLHQHLYSPAATTAPATAPSPAMAPAEAQAVHFQVDGTFEVEGVGSVVSGTLVSGSVRLGQELMLGPTETGDFTRVVVRQLQRSHVAVQQVRAGQTCTMAITPAGARPVEGAGQDGGVRDGAAGGGPWEHGDGGQSPTPLGSTVGLSSASSSKAVPIRLDMATPAGLEGSDGSGFTDVLAAAQTALELCLAGGCKDDEFGCVADASGEDELFAFDVCEGPSSPVATAGAGHHATGASSVSSTDPSIRTTGGNSRASVLPSGCEEATCTDGVNLQRSMAAGQLHSTTSLGAGRSIMRSTSCLSPLSASAPTRTVAAAVGGGGHTGSPLAFSGMVPPRKGSVLLEPALKPRTSWSFEAVLILLGGHWPARGLVSGRWPPACHDDLVPHPPVRKHQGTEPSTDETAITISTSVCEPLGRGNTGPSAPQRPGCIIPTGAAAAESGMSHGCINGGTDGARRGVQFSSADRVNGRRDGAEPGAVESEPVPPAAVSAAAVKAVSVPIDIVKRGADGQPVSRALRRRRRQRVDGSGSYVVVVHCGSVRQPAHVLVMQELFEGGAEDAASGCDHQHHAHGRSPELRISASTRAAAALLQGVREAQTGSPTYSGTRAPLSPRAGEQDLGCLVRAIMRWQHRPEWLREGAKLLVRDHRDGRVAAAGFVQQVLF